MGNFNKCEKGHIYDLKNNECPYCNGKNLDEDLKGLPSEKNESIDITVPPLPTCYAPSVHDPKDW